MDMQFAEAVIERENRCERNAIRRLVQAAPIHDSLKFRLLEHSRHVQFTDDGREIPSIPLTWLAQAVEQFAHPLGIEPSPPQLKPRLAAYHRGQEGMAGSIGHSAIGGLLGHGAGVLAGMPVGHPMLGGVIGANLGAYGGAMLNNAMENRANEEYGRQQAINHRLALNNELEDVSEEEAEQVRNFLATLRHGG